MISIPFSGSKKYYYKQVKELVLDGEYDTVLECFGGSGVLSVNLYNDGIVDRAILNDYDKLFDIYEDFLDVKDWVVSECFRRGLNNTNHDSNGSYKIVDGKKEYVPRTLLPEEERRILQGVVKEVDKKWWRLLSLGYNFCLSTAHTQKKIYLRNFKQFNGYLKTDKQREYLAVVNQIDRDSLDYKEFLEKYKALYNKKTLIIADPPYTGTEQSQYKDTVNEIETVSLLDTLWDTGCDFIFFNSELDIANRWLNEHNLQAQFYNLNETVKLKGKGNEAVVFIYRNNRDGRGKKRTDYLLHVRRSDGFKND